MIMDPILAMILLLYAIGFCVSQMVFVGAALYFSLSRDEEYTLADLLDHSIYSLLSWIVVVYFAYRVVVGLFDYLSDKSERVKLL
jgi:hypothetical protein